MQNITIYDKNEAENSHICKLRGGNKGTVNCGLLEYSLGFESILGSLRYSSDLLRGSLS